MKDIADQLSSDDPAYKSYVEERFGNVAVEVDKRKGF